MMTVKLRDYSENRIRSDDHNVARRQLLVASSLGISGAVYGAVAYGSAPSPRPAAAPADEGSVAGEKVSFAPIRAESEQPDAAPPNPDAPSKRVGFAVMGLGRLALENILPAIAQCKHARLTGLSSGDAQKMRVIATQYGVPADACYGYEDEAKLKGNAAVQVVYVVLANALHRGRGGEPGAGRETCTV